MPHFTFRAKKISGEEKSGTREAANKTDLAASLRQEGYILVSYKEKTKGMALPLLALVGFGGVSLVEKMIFARNLAEMVGAGVTLTRGIEVLSRQTSNRQFKKILLQLAESIRKGKSFSASMEEHPRTFEPIFRSMVKAGEASGKLEESLKLIAYQLERDHDLRRKIRSAFMYPLIIVIVMMLIGILMMVYVVPTLITTFAELEIELPLSTRMIIAASHFLTNQGILAALLGIGTLLLGGFFFRSRIGKLFLDTFFLKMPLIGDLTKKVNSARTARTLGSLIDAGVPILEALAITEEVVQNSYFKKVIHASQDEIQKGNPISSVFIKNEHLYPLLVGEMVEVGEETGKLSSMLFRVADFYEGEITAETKDLSIIIEPVLMVVIGFVVGFFALSMITPLYSSLQGL